MRSELSKEASKHKEQIERERSEWVKRRDEEKAEVLREKQEIQNMKALKYHHLLKF